ncbi:hypothetical protein M2275_006248 [Rhodococcus opacus]|nr:hypothetical protein [Rhodococcus opacus]
MMGAAIAFGAVAAIFIPIVRSHGGTEHENSGMMHAELALVAGGTLAGDGSGHKRS